MKKPLSPAALAAVAIAVAALLGFFVFRTFGSQGLSPEERRQERVMIERSNAESARMHGTPGASGGPGAPAISADEAKARAAAGQG